MLIKDRDYYIDLYGNYVFTERYHLERGTCCKNECKHCPWLYKKLNKLQTTTVKK